MPLPHSLYCSPPVYFPMSDILLCLPFSVWEICMVAGQRTVPHSGNCITRCQIWSWNQRSTGVLCWMKNRSVGASIQIFSRQTSSSPLKVTGLKCCDLQKQLNAETYGPNLADVEKQIAAHNILHQAIEAYSGQLTPSTTSSQVHVQVQQHVCTLQGCKQDQSFIFFFFVHRRSTPPSGTNMLTFMWVNFFFFSTCWL